MTVYTHSPSFGPTLGPPVAGFIDYIADWRWAWRVQIISVLSSCAAIGKTYTSILLKWKAARLRASISDERFYIPLDVMDINLLRAVAVSCYKLFHLMGYDCIVLLNAWNALLLWILYFTLQGFPLIFAKHGFSAEQTGMMFLGIEVGIVGAICRIPFWNRLFEKEMLKSNGHHPPETQLYMGQVGGILVPIRLFVLTFTFMTYVSVPWITANSNYRVHPTQHSTTRFGCLFCS